MVDFPTIATRALSCDALASSFSPLGLVSINATLVSAGTAFPIPEVCLSIWSFPSVAVSVDVCHVELDINTSPSSRTHLDAWLPLKGWNGRFLGTGTGGLSGCVDYGGLNYGTSMGFATIGSDAGHTGPSTAPFYNAPEVQRDFFGRAVHTEAVIGKQLVAAYYGKPPSHSYYNGCSQGGRQGFQAAGDYPYDFDGIIAGDPAVDIDKLAIWLGLASQPFLAGAPGEMTPKQWEIVHEEAFRQCDMLDGKQDRTIAYPAKCNFDVSQLLKKGLNKAQVAGLKKLYSDTYGPDGTFLFPRFAPGAENTGPLFNLTFSGAFPDFTLDFFRFGLYMDPNWDPKAFSAIDLEFLKKLNLPGVELFTDLRKFKERGGKLISYHGTQDTLINSGISERQYTLAAKETGDLTSFFALYLVPGLDHCQNINSTANGAWRFGQGNLAHGASNTSEANALLALVDWVEKGRAPAHLIGMTDAGETREICRYPSEGHWRSGKWTCGK